MARTRDRFLVPFAEIIAITKLDLSPSKASDRVCKFIDDYQRHLASESPSKKDYWAALITLLDHLYAALEPNYADNGMTKHVFREAIAAIKPRLYLTQSPLPKNSDIPGGAVVAHNLLPLFSLNSVGGGVNGFRAWLQRPSSNIGRCSCGWAPKLKEHFKIKRAE